MRKLDPGPYRIVVEGPGVSFATDVEAVETVMWEVTFVEGRYTFVCDPHATFMSS